MFKKVMFQDENPAICMRNLKDIKFIYDCLAKLPETMKIIRYTGDSLYFKDLHDGNHYYYFTPEFKHSGGTVEVDDRKVSIDDIRTAELPGAAAAATATAVAVDDGKVRLVDDDFEPGKLFDVDAVAVDAGRRGLDGIRSAELPGASAVAVDDDLEPGASPDAEKVGASAPDSSDAEIDKISGRIFRF